MKPKVMLDPGHGGIFSGAHYEAGLEKSVVLRVGIHLKRLLEAQGIEVLMTRDGDYELSSSLADDLQIRCNLEHQFSPDCFVSIHCNGHDQKSAKGFEVWTSPGETKSDQLATLIVQSAESYLSEHFHVRKDLSDGDPDKESRFKVLTGTKGCAVLAELGFLSNEGDREFLISTDGQFLMAKMLAAAIWNYLKLNSARMDGMSNT